MGREHGDIHWSELNTTDVAAAKTFYEKSVGWTFIVMPVPGEGDYHVAMKGETPVAGIFEMTGPEFAGVPPHWMTYIAVDDIDACCERVTAAGGTIIRPPFDVENVGRIAILKDNTGAAVGMMTPAPAPT